LNAPYAERVRKQVRSALNDGEDAADKVARLVEVAERLALTPPVEPTPLPLIDGTDIHLVCWMAIVPVVGGGILGGPPTIAEQIGQLPLGISL
jgi:cytochrome c-type biogenesis protein CcmH/NrfF